MGAALLTAVGLSVVGLGGCERPMHIDNSTGAPQQIGGHEQLIAKADAKVTDLPVPIGFDIDESRSDAQVAGTGRYVSHYYRGRRDKDRVASFYCDQMTRNHKWRQECVRNSRGAWRLHFSKGSERCAITIEQGFWGTTVHAEIYTIPPQ